MKHPLALFALTGFFFWLACASSLALYVGKLLAASRRSCPRDEDVASQAGPEGVTERERGEQVAGLRPSEPSSPGDPLPRSEKKVYR